MRLPCFPLRPKAEKYINPYLDKLIDKVELKIKGAGAKFHPEQIHFRGLSQLNEKQQEYFYQQLETRLNYDFRQNKNYIYFYRLQTPDNAVLDSVEVRNEDSAQQNITNRHFIVAAMPRSNNFVDWIKYYQVYANKLDVTIIAFNYRGVGLSKGIVKSEKDLYNDAEAQVQRLLQLGAKPENIAVMGECLGGNVAIHTAGTLHQEGYPVKLYSARSFRSLTEILKARCLPPKEASLLNPLTWLKWLRYGLVVSIINPLIKSSRWSLNIDKQFLSVPPHDRDFIVVRSKKDNNGKHFADDQMVPHQKASIYSLVKEKRQAILAKRTQGLDISAQKKEWIRDVPKYHKFYVSEERYTDASKANGHTVHPRMLVPTYPKSAESQTDGRQYAINFFKRIWPTKERQDKNPSTCHNRL